MNIRISRKLISISAGLVLGMLSPVLVYAECIPSELAGTWFTYSMSVDSGGSFAPQTNRCKVKINSAGNIVATKSSCKVRSRTGLINVNVTGGSIIVNSKCSLSGSIKISGPAGSSTIKLEYGTVAKDNKTLSLVAYDAGDRSYITHLTGVKR